MTENIGRGDEGGWGVLCAPPLQQSWISPSNARQERAKRLSLTYRPVSERHLASEVDHGHALTEEREMDTISGRRPLEGAVAGAGSVAAVTAAAPGSGAASAGPLAPRFGRPWFPNWRRLIGTGGPGPPTPAGLIRPGPRATALRAPAR